VAEVALEPALAAEEIERERRIVLGQLRARSDTPFQQALDHLLHDLYDPHPYAWPPLGRSPAVERATRADLVALHAAVYRPERLVLAVSGGVPARDVVRLAGRLFGRLPRSGAAASAPPPAAASRGSHRVVERPLQQAQVLVGYLGPALADPDYPAARVLGAVLGGGMSGRLFLELREKRGLAYSVGVISAFRTAPAFLAAYAGTAPASAEAVERGVLAEVERVRREGVTESEVARARAYLLGHLAMDRRTNARHAWHLAFFEVIGVGWRFPDRYARGLAAVGVEDVTQAARRYLDRPSVVVLRPGAARP
jgi:zinc protease